MGIWVWCLVTGMEGKERVRDSFLEERILSQVFEDA